MLTLAQFRVRFPEFNSANDPLVNAYLDIAKESIDSEVWGTRENEGHGYLTAHLLCLSPSGQMSRLVAKDGSTTYEHRYHALIQMIAGGFRVI